MDGYYDLGTHSRPVTTSSPDAQLWFDRGLIWTYGFNHEEADLCFRRALDSDPECAMAHWGIAYVNGPFYNKVWQNFAADELPESVRLCHESSQHGNRLASAGSPVEQALLDALCTRYPVEQAADDEGFARWMNDYTDAMREVYEQFPDDLDVAALFAEAMVTRTPWELWSAETGEPADGADTLEALEVLDKAMAQVDAGGGQAHPGVCHMYIHTMEMSPFPERALPAADGLRGLCRDAGHLQHMPCHIDGLCGRYEEAVTASHKAITADARYLAEAGAMGFYATSCCHDFHMMMYSAMFLGQYEPAAAAARAITELLTEDVLGSDRPYLAGTVEGYYSMATHVDVRFGRWQELIDALFPGSPELYVVTTPMFHYGKAIAYATLGHAEEAREHQAQFVEFWSRIPDTRLIFNNPASEILRVGESMIEGELSYHEGNYDLAFAHLREAVVRDDQLNYTEPWAWMHPPRHALGALLLEQGQVAEATDVYMADLGLDDSVQRSSQHPGNVWSLHGYVECLEHLGDQDRLVTQRPLLQAALAKTDVEIASSCACRRGT